MRRLACLAIAATVAATPLVVVTTATPANAYCFYGIGRWRYDVYSLYGRSSIPSSWRTSLKSAMKQWNGISGSRLRYGGPYWSGGGPNPEFTISRIDFQNAGLNDVPGTAQGSTTQRHNSVSVLLNSRFRWNTSGTMNQSQRKVDVWTVAVHEFGHASGLAHPYSGTPGCGSVTAAEKKSVMYVDWTRKRYPNSDDKAGIARRY